MLLYFRAWFPGPAIFGVHLMSLIAAVAFPIAFVKVNPLKSFSFKLKMSFSVWYFPRSPGYSRADCGRT